MIGDVDPIGDICSTSTAHPGPDGRPEHRRSAERRRRHVGLVRGGLRRDARTTPNGTTGCARSQHASAITARRQNDYIAHHEPFQYYPSTANRTHARPSSVTTIGQTDAANHQYDLADFFAAARRGPYSGGELPQAARLSERSRRLLRSDRRAGVPRAVMNDLQRASGVERHGGRHRL